MCVCVHTLSLTCSHTHTRHTHMCSLIRLPVASRPYLKSYTRTHTYTISVPHTKGHGRHAKTTKHAIRRGLSFDARRIFLEHAHHIAVTFACRPNITGKHGTLVWPGLGILDFPSSRWTRHKNTLEHTNKYTRVDDDDASCLDGGRSEARFLCWQWFSSGVFYACKPGLSVEHVKHFLVCARFLEFSVAINAFARNPCLWKLCKMCNRLEL